MARNLGDDRIEWQAAGPVRKSSWPLIIGVAWLAAGLGVLYSYGAPYFSPSRPTVTARVEPPAAIPAPVATAEPAKSEVTATPSPPTSSTTAEPSQRENTATAPQPTSSSGAASGDAGKAADPIAAVILNEKVSADKVAKERKPAAAAAKPSNSEDRNSAAGRSSKTARAETMEAPPASPVARGTAPVEDRAPAPVASSDGSASGGDFRSLRESVLREAFETPAR